VTPPPPSKLPIEPNTDLPTGLRLLDRYTIIERAGSGGMATIYRASDERLERIVCVKLLRLWLEGSGSTSGHGVYEATYTHFLQEALALSKLQHPNTLRIYDFGYTEDERPFQISEFLEGGNLETHVRASGRLSASETISVLERICGAVAEAHEHGIIHRDIKPSNILFARVAGAGEDRARSPIGHALVPKLADFGIASSRVRRASVMDEGDKPVSTVALFSPRWAAPEQLSGAVEGPATDVYALGLITAYMLSGRAPFADKDARTHFDDRIRGDDFTSARLAGLALDAHVRAVLTRAMAANPTARIASPLAFFSEIRAALDSVSARRSFESITLVLDPEAPSEPPPSGPVEPAERSVIVGGRTTRIVEVNERLDITVALPDGGTVDDAGTRVLRFRLALLPSPGGEGFALHVKGLNCFIARESHGGRPTPAITATGSGAADFVSGSGATMASVAWSFGRPSDNVGLEAGRLFDVGSGELVIPYAEASQAIAIDLGLERDVIVMCRGS
jgi:serine/threonine protein kinase